MEAIKKTREKEFLIKRDALGNTYSQQEIVRCKECCYYRGDEYCERFHITVKETFFCADNER